MDKKGKLSIFGVLVLVVLFIAMVGVIASQVNDAQTYPTDTTTGSQAQAVPYNITLDESDCISLNSVTNGSSTLPATNYTDYCVTADIIQIDDNTSYVGTITATYTYDDGNTILGATSVLLGLIALFLAIYFITFLRKYSASK